MRAVALLLLASTGSLVGCSAGSPASLVRPADPKASEALGEAACRDVKRGGEPLIVDLPPHERANFEEAMLGGLALVHYDCARLELARNCRADGTYAFQGLSPREFAVKLEDADEVRANLPSFGAALVGKLETEMERGATIDLAVALIGKKKTTVAELTQSALRGSCGDATHFVRGVHLGAFAMTTGSRGSVRAAAEIFGAGVGAASQSAKIGVSRDGDLEACRGYLPSAAEPPEKCRSLVRLELAPLTAANDAIVASAKVAQLAATAEACPDGMVMADEHCQKPGDKPFQCRSDRPVECQEQCDKGHAGSCAELGLLYTKGAGVPLDPSRAGALFATACDRGSLIGCVNQGVTIEKSPSADIARAVGLYRRGCDGGEALGCYNLAIVYELGKGTVADAKRAAELYARGCDGGEGLACANLGVMLERGQGIPKDVSRATRLYERGCDGGGVEGCFNLGVLLASGAEGVAKDDVRALGLFRGACEGGFGEGCFNVGVFFDEGRGGAAKDGARAFELWMRGCDLGSASACLNAGLASEEPPRRDLARAAKLYARACDLKSPAGCTNLGVAFESGEGVSKDATRAARLFKEACDGGFARACLSFGLLLEAGKGVTRDDAHAAQLYRRACDADAPEGCSLLGDLYAAGRGGLPKDPAAAKRFTELGCKRGDKAACAP